MISNIYCNRIFIKIVCKSLAIQTTFILKFHSFFISDIDEKRFVMNIRLKLYFNIVLFFQKICLSLHAQFNKKSIQFNDEYNSNLNRKTSLLTYMCICLSLFNSFVRENIRLLLLFV